MNNDDLAKLIKKIGYSFKDATLMEAALSHRSVGNQNYERLEFLGDSILNCIIAIELFQRYPKAKEGELSRLRASLVNGEMLATLAKEFKLGDYLRLGVGELKSGGFQRKSILADSMEAIIGAIYLDADFAACQHYIIQWFEPHLKKINTNKVPKDAKTQLQEFLQSKRMTLPKYRVLSVVGEPHKQVFRVECTVASAAAVTEGAAGNRRAAEQQAAKNMFELLSQSAAQAKIF